MALPGLGGAKRGKPSGWRDTCAMLGMRDRGFRHVRLGLELPERLEAFWGIDFRAGRDSDGQN